DLEMLADWLAECGVGCARPASFTVHCPQLGCPLRRETVPGEVIWVQLQPKICPSSTPRRIFAPQRRRLGSKPEALLKTTGNSEHTPCSRENGRAFGATGAIV